MVIVPGYPFKDNAWDDVMKMRVYWAKHLYDIGVAKNIIFSGSAVYSPYYEAKIMKLYAEKIGIPSAHIFTETKAEHSTENLYYSYYKAKKMGFKTIAFATDPFQSRMMNSFIHKKMKNDIAQIPIVYDVLRGMDLKNPLINSKDAYDSTFVSLVDRESFWKRLNGTRGKNIDTTAYKN